MIAVDTNILVYAHRQDSPWHAPARQCVKDLAEGRAPWAIAWNCLREFLAITTSPRIYNPPTPLGVALSQVEYWLQSPALVLLAEGPGYWDSLKGQATVARVAGAAIHDAHLAALCLEHGVAALWSADRDFTRFHHLKVVNPLVD